MTLQEFFDKVSRVDFLYSMSDAPGAYERGRQRVSEVREQAESLGPLYVRIFEDWRAYMSSCVTGADVAMPKLEDYTQECTHG